MSPTASHPSTPSAEPGVGTWGSHSTPAVGLARAHNRVEFISLERPDLGQQEGGAAIEAGRGAPVAHLNTSANSATASYFGEGTPTQTSPTPRDQGPNSQIPFAIPLHPTPKTYRSQSYSVGQLEPDAAAVAASPMTTAAGVTTTMGTSTIMGGRGRQLSHSALQHRPSRPSMLSEMSNEGGMLGKVKEVDDDDDESTSESLQGSQQQSSDAKTIEMLTRENAILRQQHASQQYHSRIRPRASTAAAYGIGNGYGLHEPSVPEESDFAVDELDDANEAAELAKRAINRRMSEFSGPAPFRSPYAVENRKLETVKKGLWQSSLGFGGVGRHLPEPATLLRRCADQAGIHQLDQRSRVGPRAGDPGHSKNSAGFCALWRRPQLPSEPGPIILLRRTQSPRVSASHAGIWLRQQPIPDAVWDAHRLSQQAGLAPSGNVRHDAANRSTPLHIVLFKCARADVFYIQEGTGLTVKPGDLVIVEADRGTDLGTVAVDNVDWVEAKRLKEHYAEEQYKWLMMYSQNAGVAQDGVGAGLMAASNGLQGSAVGGMGPPGPPGQHHMQEPNPGELKPKLIKRLAQNHEIQALRDKEGNEAKAKRVCMQKVKEHGLTWRSSTPSFRCKPPPRLVVTDGHVC